MSSSLEGQNAVQLTVIQPEELPDPPPLYESDKHSAVVAAYALFYIAGIALGLLIGWLLWKR